MPTTLEERPEQGIFPFRLRSVCIALGDCPERLEGGFGYAFQAWKSDTKKAFARLAAIGYDRVDAVGNFPIQDGAMNLLFPEEIRT